MSTEVTEFTYRMACGKCDSSLSYTGATEMKVNHAVLPHLNEIWDAINQQHDSGVPTSIVVDCQEHGGDASSEFMDQLGRHIAQKHCRREHFQSKGEFLQWCRENIRVSIKMHKYQRRPETDGTFEFANKESHEFVLKQAEKEHAFEMQKKELEEQKKRERLQMLEARTSKEKEYLDSLWDERYKELGEYIKEHGNTVVSQRYPAKPLLAIWAEKQRTQYRLKHSGLDENPAMTDRREALLDEIGFVKGNRLKPRWDERGIAVMYGYKLEDVIFLHKMPQSSPDGINDS